MSRLFLVFGAISGFVSVALGAFGAHALKGMLSEYSLSIFNTANDYQSVHTLVLLVLGILLRIDSVDKKADEESRLLRISGYSFIVGIILFSGSLYSLALTGISVLGAITPLGGLAFLCGWSLLGIYAYKFKCA